MTNTEDETIKPSANEKTPNGALSSDKFLYLHNIIDQYEIRHPKPSISRNTAKKMLLRDLQSFVLSERDEAIKTGYEAGLNALQCAVGNCEHKEA